MKLLLRIDPAKSEVTPESIFGEIQARMVAENLRGQLEYFNIEELLPLAIRQSLLPQELAELRKGALGLSQPYLTEALPPPTPSWPTSLTLLDEVLEGTLHPQLQAALLRAAESWVWSRAPNC